MVEEKKLNRYFIDEKIPSAQRGQIPVLADGSHIVWVVGYRISAYYKVTEQTEDILSVTIKEKTQE
jgi:tRNA(Ile)-lysidine synthase